jgi:hypothetical protein
MGVNRKGDCNSLDAGDPLPKSPTRALFERVPPETPRDDSEVIIKKFFLSNQNTLYYLSIRFFLIILKKKLAKTLIF